MPYELLKIADAAPPDLHVFVADTFDLYLRDVHGLLSVSAPQTGPIRHQFQIAATVTLLAVVAGASRTIYAEEGKSGPLFADVLINFYPWDLDPPEGLDKHGASWLLYDYFRNPLVHAVGVKSSRRIVKIGRAFPGLPNKDQVARIDGLAIADLPPQPTLRLESDKAVLWVESFYWGVRKMIERVLADPERCRQAFDWINSQEFKPTA